MKGRVLRRRADAISPVKFRLLSNSFALIVQTVDIQPHRQRQIRLGEVHRGRCRACRIFFMNNVAKFLRYFRTNLAVVLFADFVADAPQRLIASGIQALIITRSVE